MKKKSKKIEDKVIELFEKAWKKSSKKKYTGSYPFTYSDKWSGKAVMDFAKYIVKYYERKINKYNKLILSGLNEQEKRISNLEKLIMKKVFNTNKLKNNVLKKIDEKFDQYFEEDEFMYNFKSDLKKSIEKVFKGEK